MKSVSWCVVAVATALLGAGGAWAETEAEYGNPGPAARDSRTAPIVTQKPAAPQRAASAPARAGPSAAARAASSAVPRPMPPAAARATPFAAAAAANAKPMAPQEREERRFLRQAAAATRFQADAARLALNKATSPGVRSLATTLVERQAVGGNELLHMLHQRGMAAPMLENDQRKTLNRLAKLQARKFDREFIDQVAMRSQQQEVDSYQKASLSVQDPALKDWIARSLPTLRSQLASAERVSIPETHAARSAGHSSAATGRALRKSAGHSLRPAATARSASASSTR